MVLFTGFAIPISIIAMGEFGVLGMALAAFLAYQWIRVAGLGEGTPVEEAVEMLRPSVPGKAPKSSGNASFDAYREDMIDRLEKEQDHFETFLTRLRAAKDKTEFDQFMEDRAKVARAKTGEQS